jgi:hypothetical protein
MAQRDWRFCGKCFTMFFDGYPDKGACPGGGKHQAAGYNFVLPFGMAPGPQSQGSWTYCNKCHSLFFNGDPAHRGVCQLGGSHDGTGALNFVLPVGVPGSATQQAGWRHCNKCRQMFWDGVADKGHCAAGGPHVAGGLLFTMPHDPVGPFPFTPAIPIGNIGAQNDWRCCGQCNMMFWNGGADKGACAIGGPHQAFGFDFFLPLGAEDQPHAQSDWRCCVKCASLFWNGDHTNTGLCPRGGAHDAGATFHFALPHSLPEVPLAQTHWRHCGKCRSMFFDGAEMKGTCPGGGSHAASGLAFTLPHDMHQPITFTTLFESGGAAAFALTGNVTFNLDGSVRWWGEARNTGIDGYDYSAAVVVKTPMGHAAAMSHSGHVNGHPVLGSGTRHDYWDTTYPGAASLFFAEMAWGNLQRNVQYKGWFTSVFDSLVSWAIQVGAGELIGPIGLVAFLGAEIGSLISSGSLAAGGRLIGGTLWLAGPSNMLFALAGEGIASLGSKQRQLTHDEYTWADQMVFHGSLPPIEKIVLTNTNGGQNRPFTFPMPDGRISVNLGSGYDNPRGVNGGATLIHELVHTCQLWHGLSRIGYIAQGLAARACEAGGGHPYSYGPPGPPYSSFHLEQQAQIVEEWFQGTTSPTKTARDPANPYYRYVLDAQAGNF